jgi:hypothetical protein
MNWRHFILTQRDGHSAYIVLFCSYHPKMLASYRKKSSPCFRIRNTSAGRTSPVPREKERKRRGITIRGTTTRYLAGRPYAKNHAADPHVTVGARSAHGRAEYPHPHGLAASAINFTVAHGGGSLRGCHWPPTTLCYLRRRYGYTDPQGRAPVAGQASAEPVARTLRADSPGRSLACVAAQPAPGPRGDSGPGVRPEDRGELPPTSILRQSHKPSAAHHSCTTCSSAEVIRASCRQ